MEAERLPLKSYKTRGYFRLKLDYRDLSEIFQLY